MDPLPYGVGTALGVEMDTVEENDKENNDDLSRHWGLIKDLKPRLRGHVEVHRHVYRGRDWYLLQDHSTGNFNRFTPETYQIIGLMDSERTMEEIYESAKLRLGTDMPSINDVVGLVFRLYQSDVLQSDRTPNIKELHRRSVVERQKKWVNYIRSPFSVRIPLLDPEKFLNNTASLIRPLFTKAAAVVWCTAMLIALVLCALNWSELTSNVTDRVLSTENLILLWIVYPIVKLFHEFGHAYGVKRWGGEVHEMGIMILVFMPIPYVDASASTAFRSKSRRMTVGGMGIMVEAFIAALAMFVWVSVEPGIVRAISYNVMLIAGVSTLLFNGNPLLRFDAYYILGDYLEISNLGARSNGYVGYVIKRYILGIKEAVSPATTSGEERWLFIYGVASFIYRIFIMVAIVLFVAGKFFLIGVILAIWGFTSSVVLPLIRTARYLVKDPVMKLYTRRTGVVISAVALTVAVFIFIIPMPSMTVAEGVVWSSDDSVVHAGADGYIVKVIAAPGSNVKQGQVLIESEAPELDSEVSIIKARLKELEARHRAAMIVDRIEMEIIKDEIVKVSAELKHFEESRAHLLVRSPVDGVFLLPGADDLPGHFVRKGTSMGYVADFSKVIVRVVVEQDQVELVRNHTQSVEGRLSEDIFRAVAARIEREVPAATKELPSLALSLEGGGLFALDPKQTVAENQAPRAFKKVFHFDVLLSDVQLDKIGERVFVRFKHTPEPFATQWYRDIRRVFLRRFDV